MTNPALPAPPIRHDGWTILRQQIFLETLAATASVTAGADAAGLSVSSAYRFRRSRAGQGFRAGWDAAMEVGGQRLGDYALDKAIKGFARPVYDRDGKLHHIDTRHDGRLLMFMLERLDRTRFGCSTYEQRQWAATAGDRFAEALDTLAAAEAAEEAALEAAAAGAGSEGGTEAGGIGGAGAQPALAAPQPVPGAGAPSVSAPAAPLSSVPAPSVPAPSVPAPSAPAPSIRPRGPGGRWATAAPAKTPPTP